VNLVGHVATTVRHAPRASPTYLAGAIAPDLASIARVRLVRASGGSADPTVAAELRRGLAFHHAGDAAFHASSWFRDRNHDLRDALLTDGVDRGAARACSHAGVEMLLDGGLVDDARVAQAMDDVFRELGADTATRRCVHELVADDDRARWAERLDTIMHSLDVRAYTSPNRIAHRLHRATSGRARIELREVHVDAVAHQLGVFQPGVVADADAVINDVAAAIGPQ
jgi:hypothetical protein